MIDGKTNIRYLLLNMTHPSYNGMITSFTNMHTAKEAGNTLTVLPNIANTQAVVKVVAHVGWIQEEDGRLEAGLINGSIIAVHPYEELNQVHAYLASNEWPQADPLI